MLYKASFFLSLLFLPLLSNAQARGTLKPRFQGNLNKYLTQHVKYPQNAIDKDMEGECLVQFMVDEKGMITRIHQVKSSGDIALDKEAERLIAGMPSWQPGTYNSIPARFVYVVPVSFRLQ